MIAAVPDPIAASLTRKAYYFVPLTVNQGDETVIADRYDVALSDNAVCHRNLNIGDAQCVFISTRLMDDKFSVAFEFYINVGHALVERAGVSQEFRRPGLAASRSWCARRDVARRLGSTQVGHRSWSRMRRNSRTNILRPALRMRFRFICFRFYLDVDYYDLRERDYPLLAPQPWQNGCARLRRYSPRTPGLSSTSTTSGARKLICGARTWSSAKAAK